MERPSTPARTSAPLHLSGILVQVTPSRIEQTEESLTRLNGVDVHHRDAATGKIVATLETPSREDAVQRLREIRKLPGVYVAEPVYHYVGEDAPEPPAPLAPLRLSRDRP
jgi:periplasmic nitrate reductase NapD